MIWENSEGATFKERQFITYVDKETQEREISNGFHKLGLALSGGDLMLGRNFFADSDNGAYINIDRMQQAIGCTVDIKIGLPKKGTGIKNVDGEVFAFDIESGEIIDEVGGFSDIKELMDAAKEYGLKITFNKVLTHKVNRDESENNKQQISTALEASKEGKTTNTPQVEGF